MIKPTLIASIKQHAHWLVLGLFVALVGLFFYRTIIFGKLPVPSDDLVGMYHPWRDAYAHTFQNGVPFKNFLITDPIRQQIPWRKQVIDALKKGKLPLWNAYDFSGTPLLGNIQSGALYPLNFLFLIFPFEIAWSLLVISQPLLAGIFLYLFLRNKQIEPIAAFAGSVIFAFSGFSVSWLTWGTIGSTIAWLPLMLLALDNMHNRVKKWPWRTVFVIAVISSFFAGHLQVFFYAMLVMVTYTCWQMRKIKITRMFPMHMIIPGIILLITSPVWMRFISVFLASSRSVGASWNSEGFFVPIRHLVQFIAPDYFGNPSTLNYWGTWNYGELVGYVGIIGLAFAVAGIGKASMFWFGSVVVCLLFALDGPVARLPYILHIPFLSSLQPTRLMGIVDFGLSILAAYGFSSMVKNEKKTVLNISVAGVGILLFGLWGSVLKPNIFHVPLEQLAVIKHNLILPTVMYGVLAIATIVMNIIRAKWQSIRILCLIGIVGFLSFDLIRFGWKFTPFTDPSYFFPKTEIIETLEQIKKPFRVLVTDDRLVPPNVLGFYKIESVSGYDPVYASRYEEFIAAMERGEANINPPFGFNRIINPKTITSPLFSLLNVSYVLSMDKIATSSVRLLSEEGTTKLYSVVTKVPRAYFAEQFFFENSKEAVIKRMYTKEFIPGKSAVLEGEGFIVGEEHTEDTVDIGTYDGDAMTLNTSSKNTRYLVIGNMMDPHWHVSVDGKEVTVYRTNYLFFGCIVPGGMHQIKVQYR